MYTGKNQIHQVDSSFKDTERSQGETNLSLGGDVQVLVFALVAVPVVEGRRSHRDPHEQTYEVHDYIRE